MTPRRLINLDATSCHFIDNAPLRKHYLSAGTEMMTFVFCCKTCNVVYGVSGLYRTYIVLLFLLQKYNN